MTIILTEEEIKEAIQDFLNKRFDGTTETIKEILIRRKSQKNDNVGSITIKL